MAMDRLGQLCNGLVVAVAAGIVWNEWRDPVRPPGETRAAPPPPPRPARETPPAEPTAPAAAPAATGTEQPEAPDDVPSGAVRGDGTTDCPPDYPVKGNADSMIYHLPGESSYDRTEPEFCFATAEGAEAAGFRPRRR